MILVIGEKPSVSKELAKVLGATKKNHGFAEGNGYIVSWCYGHLVSMKYPNDYGEKWSGKWAFSQLPMIPDNWKFSITESTKEQYGVLKELMNRADVEEIICATDADREGECIFRYVYNMAKCRKPVKRLWISSLEETSIRKGMQELKSSSAYDSLYQAGFCRAKADWLVGMNGSRLFSVRYHAQLNTGRVQTPTLAMIVKRDNEVSNFVKQKYFTVDIDCGFKAVSERIDNEETANNLVALCSGKSANVTEITKEIKSVNPPKLFDLTSLQREANKKFGYTAQQTLDYMQSLYEGKLVTYPRTDSQYLTEDMRDSTLCLIPMISAKFGFGAVGNPDITACINNAKVTGHHAIIPTESVSGADISSLPTGEQNILKLVSLRLLCAASSPYRYESVKVGLLCENTTFSATGRTVLEMGWKSLESKVGEQEKEAENTLPSIYEGMRFTVSAMKSEHFTSPPKAYTEDTLLSAMEHAGAENFDENAEKKGLGTPATRAGTIENLIKHGYVVRDGKKIVSTDKGKNLINVIPEEIRSPMLTAEWENQLLEIERGTLSADKFMSEIEKYVTDLCSKYSTIDDSVCFGEKSESIGNCPKCAKPVIKGKFGWYCSGKCGMNVAKVYGISLSQSQIKGLLEGRQTTVTLKGKKNIVLPNVVQNEYNGRTYYNWETKKG
jgi:DNA topoisomerase-3